MTPRVFVPQQPMKRDPATRQLAPTHNLSGALRFGELKILLPSGPVMLSTAPMVKALRERLFDYSDDDCIIGIGSPAAIAATCMVAAMMNEGRVRLLQYDRQEGEYIELAIDATGRTERV